jgi:hypothetical protein
LSARAKDLALVKKFLVALLGLAAMAVTQGLISGTAAEWVAIGVAGATAAGVYIVPNKTLAAS